MTKLWRFEVWVHPMGGVVGPADARGPSHHNDNSQLLKDENEAKGGKILT